jgi:hypothetical protein
MASRIYETPLYEFRALSRFRATAFSVEQELGGVDTHGGPRIIVGDNPILVGSFVSDLRFEPVSGAIQTVRWTQPAGIRRRPPENKAEYLGQPTEKTFRVTVGGDVSEIRDVAAFEYD